MLFFFSNFALITFLIFVLITISRVNYVHPVSPIETFGKSPQLKAPKGHRAAINLSQTIPNILHE